MSNVKIYAEDVPYFQTSKRSSDTWLAMCKKEIQSVGGKVMGEMFGYDHATGRSSFLLQFQIVEDQFKLVWPVLPSRKGNDGAAKIQAATALYHDVKARVVSAKFLGIKGAFFNYYVLPNGQTASEVGANDFLECRVS